MAIGQFVGTTMASIKGGRGLLLAEPALGLQANIRRTLGYEPVTPGQDTVITVTATALPRNADVKSCRATLLASGPSGLRLAEIGSAPSATDIKIKGPGTEEKNYEVEVAQQARPRNVTLRLDGGDVFFRFGDQLTSESYELPDFATQLNAYLDQYQGGEPVALRFLLTSDAPGSADIRLDELTFRRIQTQTWTNPADATTRVDRSFELDYGDVRDVEMLPLPADNSKRRMLTVTVDATGDFGPERSLGDASLQFISREFATIDADYGAAQSLRPAIDVQCVALAFVLATSKPASIYAALYANSDGQPDITRPPLGETQLEVESGDGQPRWTYAQLPAPVALRADEDVWIVCRGIQGDAQLATTRAPLSLLQGMRVSRGGNIWRSFSHNEQQPARALVRPIYLPSPENSVAAISLVMRSATSAATHARVPLDPTAQSQTVPVALDGVQDNQAVRAEVHSNARGTLTLTSLIQEYE
jgi:hypothetical protein